MNTHVKDTADLNLGKIIKSPKTRLWLYGIVGAASPLLVAYGAVTQDQAALWVGLAGAVLGTGGNALAAANTPTKDDAR